MSNFPVVLNEHNIPFAENPDPRLPMTLILDTSYSMDGFKIKALNQGLKKLWEEVNLDVLTKRRAMISIIGCGAFEPYEIQPMVTVQDVVDFLPEDLEASGGTPMDQSLTMALDKIEMTKQTIRSNDGQYFRPLIFILSDGEFHLSDSTKMRLHREVNEEKVKVIPFGVGHDADTSSLAATNPSGLAIQLEEQHFGEFFEFLSASISVGSQDTTSDEKTVEATQNMRVIHL